MAITDEEKGVWGVDKVFAKQNQGSIWDYDTSTREFWLWGYNSGYGNLGQNNRTNYSSAVQIPGTTWKMIYSDGDAIGATRTDGTFWVWGRNSNNQGLGIQANGYRSSPVQLPGTNWPTEPGKATFAAQHSAAIKTDGTLWTWGFNSYGRLGLGDNQSWNSPKQIPGTTWKTVSVNYEATYATKTDGTAWSWGWNDNGTNSGILGHNSETRYSSPIQIGSDTNWSHIQTCGGGSVLATKTNGSLWVWGSNSYGQLGLNQSSSYVRKSSPTQIGSDTDWATGADKIRTSSRYHMGAIKTDGTLWTWGENGYGQLGQNNRTDRSSPRQIPGTWSQISMRHDCCFALNSDNEVWVWGRNHQGQLAQNHNNHRSSPVQVHGLNPSGTFSRVQAMKDGAAVIEDK